jgi:hypothetical protein
MQQSAVLAGKGFFVDEKISLDWTAWQYSSVVAASWIFRFFMVDLSPIALLLKKASCGHG